MEIDQGIELVALSYFDGKIDEGSSFEVEQCKSVIDQIKNDPNISQRTLALCWIYFQAHAKDPLGQFIKVTRIFLMKNSHQTSIQPVSSLDNDLWVFDQHHFKDTVTLLLLNDKKDKDEIDLQLKKLILMQFDNDMDMKTWTMDLFDTVRSKSVLTFFCRRLVQFFGCYFVF